jgi:hypothetical protein
LLSDGQAIVATAASAPTALTGASNAGLEDVMVYNPGPLIVYARVGDINVVATPNSMPIFPQTAQTYSRSGATYIALLSPNGNQAVTVFMGNGQ